MTTATATMPVIDAATDPTRAQFLAYQAAYDYFNDALWDGKLPRCILNFSRVSKANGFFAPQRWAHLAGITHEISLNPDVLDRPLKETMGTLVHEMAHLWQEECGKPSRSGYHNKEWADEMDRIGLPPSDTGQPGGKRTGPKMTHYIGTGGAFERAFDEMPASVGLPWRSAGILDEKEKKKSRNKNKLKYECETCGLQVWGKSDLNVKCGECDVQLEQEQPEEDEDD